MQRSSERPRAAIAPQCGPKKAWRRWRHSARSPGHPKSGAARTSARTATRFGDRISGGLPAAPIAARQENLMIAADRLRFVPANLPRRHAARVLKPPDPIDDRAHPNAKLGRRPMPRQSTLQNRSDRALPKISRIGLSHPCWPPPSQHLESEQDRFWNPNSIHPKVIPLSEEAPVMPSKGRTLRPPSSCLRQCVRRSS